MAMNGFTRHLNVLDNGLRVVTIELPHLHTASVVMYARVGSRYEEQRDNGLSHFLEHMLFRGTARYPDAYQINYAIEAIGGTLYAETGRDYSLYQLSLHPDTLADGIDLFGEIFRSPSFTSVDVERRIILEEILEDLDEENRNINVDDVARGAIFPDHPLGFPITGPYANVERFNLEDVRRHFARCYGARNMILAVSGNIDRQAVVERVRAAMTSLPSGETLATQPPPQPPSGGKARLHYVANQGSQTSLQLLFRAFPDSSPEYPAQLALSRILDDGMSTRLHHRICDELGLAYYVSGTLDTFSDAALFEIDASCAHANVSPLCDEVLRLVGDLRREPPTAAELDKAKRRFRWDLESAFDDPDAMAGWWGGTELYQTPVGLEEKLARMAAVTTDDVRRCADAVFRGDRLVVAAVGQLERGSKGLREVRSLVESYR